MPVGTATVTAKTGPAIQNTAVVLAGITSIVFDIRRQVIQLYQGNELTGPAKEFDATGITTFTIATPGANPTVTIS